jgi:hypothetical protein
MASKVGVDAYLIYASDIYSNDKSRNSKWIYKGGLTTSYPLSIQRRYFWNLMLKIVSIVEMIEEVDVVHSYIALVDEIGML